MAPILAAEVPIKKAGPYLPLLQQARKILLVRLRSLGDAVLMTPVPTILREAAPQAQISVLVEEQLEPLFREHPAVYSVMTLPRSPSYAQRLGCIHSIRRSRFDIVMNLHSGSTAGIITALSGAPVRVAYETARYARFCNIRIPASATVWGRESVHTVEHQLSPLAHLGAAITDPIQLLVRPSAEPSERARSRMASMEVERGRFFLIHPFATLFTKEWELARYAELAGKLVQSYGVPVVATAGPGEAEKLKALIQLSGGAVQGLSALPLGELIAWVDACGMYIGNDSGPTHIAAALGKKIVVIWGSSDYRAWHPWNAPYQMLRADLPCIPCPGYRCYEFDTPRCIESISVSHVIAAVERLRPFQ